MKKILAALLTLVFILGMLPTVSLAASQDEYFTYATLSDGTVSITGLTTAGKSQTALAIPATIDGKVVTNIGASAFMSRSGITNIIIPNGVTSISDKAFYNCSGLTNVELPDSLTAIGNSAFQGCSSLESISIPDGVTSIGDWTFGYCSNLSNITLTNSVMSIGNKAFYGCNGLLDVYYHGAEEQWNKVTIGSANTPLLKAEMHYIRDYIYTIEFYANGGSGSVPETISKTGADSSIVMGKLSDTVLKREGFTFLGWSASGSTKRIVSSNTDQSWTYADYCSNTGGDSSNTMLKLYAQWEQISISEPTPVDCFTWTTLADGTFSITGLTTEGKSQTVLVIPASVGGKAVTNIGENAFASRFGITNIIIPNGVTSIGKNAFNNCTGLVSVKLPDSLTSIGTAAFQGCSSLTVIAIPDGITSIDEWTFGYCSSLTSVIIPKSVTRIVGKAFYGCGSLSDVFYYGTEEQWNKITIGSINTPLFDAKKHYLETESSAFTYTILSNGKVSITGLTAAGRNQTVIVIPETIDGKVVTNIGESAFMSRSGITSITVPNGVTSISKNAFYNCTGLKEINLLGSISSIGSSAFYGCSSLAVIAIPNGITSIDEWTFGYCSNLTSVSIPKSVTRIGNRAFYNCKKFTDVYYYGTEQQWNRIAISSGSTELSSAEKHFFETELPSDAKNFTWTVLSNGTISITGLTTEGKSQTLISIPDSIDGKAVTNIGESAFASRSVITSITVPNGVTSIGNKAFYNCTGLVDVELPNSLISIGNSVFNGCTGLTKVNIPNGVTSIGEWAFGYCSNLSRVDLTYRVTSIGNKAFYSCNNLSDVYYSGTEEQWNRMTIGSSNSALLNAERHYVEIEQTEPVYYTYTIEFDANGGSGSIPATISKTGTDSSVVMGTIDSTVPTREGYTFLGWSASSSGTKRIVYSNTTDLWTYADYCSSTGGDSSNTTLTLYAQWEQIPIPEPTPVDCFTWTTLADGTVSITGLTTKGKSQTEIVIPANIDGKAVTNIGASAFMSRSGITSITILSGVTSIGNKAFYNCSGLTSVELPSSLISIGNNAFQSCSSLTSITIPNGATSIGEWAFGYCSGLANVTIPKSVASIGNKAFYGCSNLAEVHYIGTQAEWGQITIGSGNAPINNPITLS